MPNLDEERLQKIADALKPQKPITTIRELEREAGLPQSTINQILKGKIKLTPERAAKLLPVLKKYNLL